MLGSVAADLADFVSKKSELKLAFGTLLGRAVGEGAACRTMQIMARKFTHAQLPLRGCGGLPLAPTLGKKAFGGHRWLCCASSAALPILLAVGGSGSFGCCAEAVWLLEVSFYL